MALTSTPNAQNIKEVNAIMTRSGIIQEDPTRSTIYVATSSNKEDLPGKEVKKNISLEPICQEKDGGPLNLRKSNLASGVLQFCCRKCYSNAAAKL
ncbi:hypothetical protein TIFTF001_035359 [Ficus carica]|uniref:Uncharacterized protein n=1 Tax=Ficus carica TaxID=3494 RepID=A0AA88EAC4_FICCA|nr:hypothetical protein TIFTF001_035359 [Ficus carica]